MMEGGSSWSAYGSGGSAGSGFDIVAFLKKPQVILRLVSWVFSIIVFSCISANAYSPVNGACAYGEKSNCGYGTAVGVLAFLGLLVFLVLDALFDNLSNVDHRKYIVIGDIAFSGVWSFLWFVCFCLLTNKWTANGEKDKFTKSGVEAAIAFSFFSIGTFIALTVLAVIRYRKGVVDEFPPEYDPSAFAGNAPYSGSEQGSAPPYQAGSGEIKQSPFTSQDPKPLPGGYQQQTY